MKRKPRIHYSDTQKSLMWDRWQKGDPIRDIARLFDRGHSSISRIFSETGGFRPPQRKRSRLVLTLAEREMISRGIAAQLSMQTIASRLGRSPSTVSREIQRNGGYAAYRASVAEAPHGSKPCAPRSVNWRVNRNWCA
jgi:IS30 family transposase